jgi:hypothetical protein
MRLVVLAGLFAVGCSSSPPPLQEAGIPDRPDIVTVLDDAGTMRMLTDLTLRERKLLCDWSAQITGGYGHVWSCEAGIVVNHQSQQACIAQYLGACTSVSIEQWIACQKKIASDPCALYLYSSAECKPVLRCAGLIDGGPPPPEDDAGAD